jgi:2TM domain
MQYQDEFARAKKVAGVRIAFYIHLTAYTVVNALLIIINLATSTRHFWFMWPLLGWGVGLVAHAFATFALPAVPGVKRRMIEKQMRKKDFKQP